MIIVSNRKYECIKHHVESKPLEIGEKCAPCTLIGMMIRRDASLIKPREFKWYADRLRGEGLMKRSRP